MPARSLALLLLLLHSVHALAAPAPQVGFQYRHMPDGTEVGIWYPATGHPTHQHLGIYEQDVVTDALPVGHDLPLVVISHGHGGAFSGHLDTAVALANAGFVVASLTHPGDNWRDESRATHVEDRPKALSRLITYMLSTWSSHTIIDPARIGAFGFSSGGFTVLAAAGGKPDFSRVAAHCSAHPEYYDCQLVRQHPGPLPIWTGHRDGRIKAIVVAAPALGYTFGREGLSSVTIPVQLWRADDDHVLPAPLYADEVRADLTRLPEFHDVPEAGHFDFLAPCAAPLPICQSAAGFDRAAFHQVFDKDVVRFFSRVLH
ncbi:alpha/beta hydrolase family protein [Nguyenibacter vanlangensis]|uniref:Prolyl oligopeptidase family serine peptidase n=1 Tax=Nguyenibacter vanlangensis TaxID=1216886 RepID=A0A7Y7ITE1_9PROT|nr:prolyl oligopeptidase family serine peptidase [Nguyenibacter vanlangensis]NVN09763.1 prolyl oligopeptidase family serine peptidase [Nguyenibacter vanlangensis]